MTVQRLAPTIGLFTVEDLERIRRRHEIVEARHAGEDIPEQTTQWSVAYLQDVGLLLDVLRARESIDANVDVVAPTHAHAARETGRRMLPRSGAKRRAVYDWILARGERGATADEVGEHFGWPHQSYSSAVSSLTASGWLTPAPDGNGGHRERLTRHGNQATVWLALPEVTDA